VSQVSSVPYDDRPLPALRKTAGRGEVEAVSPRPAGGEYAHSPRSSHSSPGLPGGTAEPETLSEMAQREASMPIEVFGEGLVRCDVKCYFYGELCELMPGT